VTIPQLEKQPFVILDRTFANNRYVYDLFQRHGLVPNVVMETSQFHTLSAMVSAGEAISFVYRAFIDLHPGLVGIPIAQEDVTQQINLAWMRERYIGNGLRSMIQYAKAQRTLLQT